MTEILLLGLKFSKCLPFENHWTRIVVEKHTAPKLPPYIIHLTRYGHAWYTIPVVPWLDPAVLTYGGKNGCDLQL